MTDRTVRRAMLGQREAAAGDFGEALQLARELGDPITEKLVRDARAASEV